MIYYIILIIIINSIGIDFHLFRAGYFIFSIFYLAKKVFSGLLHCDGYTIIGKYFLLGKKGVF